MNIAVITLSINNLNYSPYSINNSKRYCKKWNYDFILYEDLLDDNFSVVSNKSLAIKENLKNYDCVLIKDLDSLFVDFSKPLINLIDTKFNYVASKGRYSLDNSINAGHIFFMNNKNVQVELNNLIDRVRKIKVKGEQAIINSLIWENKLTKFKKIQKHILNAHIIPTEVLDDKCKKIKVNKKYGNNTITSETFPRIVDNDMNKETYIVHFFGDLGTEKQLDFNFLDKKLEYFKELYKKVTI